MQKWEYLQLDVKYGSYGGYISELRVNQALIYERRKERGRKQPLILVEYLAKLGLEGWEIADVYRSRYTGYENRYIFKRPIE